MTAPVLSRPPSHAPADDAAARPREFVSLTRDGWMLGAARGPAILMYHKIGAPLAASRLPALYVGRHRFGRQAAELAASGLPCLLPDGALAAARAGQAGFCLTFDDGFRNAFDHALPLLQAHGLRAVMFLVAGLIGREDEWDRAIGEPPQPLMDDAQIRDWLAAGQEIGSHTLTHPQLTALPPARARAEIFDSKKLLEDRFGREVRHFCYPYGDCAGRELDLAAEAGYATACTTRFAPNDPGVGAHDLCRIMAADDPAVLTRLARAARRRLARGIGARFAT